MPSVRTNDVETYYERRGSGPPIVFVHGALLDHAQWDRQVEALSEEYTTITYDVRGHGRTGGSRRDAYSIELFADDLAALLTEIDVERPVLCGQSMGGLIAQVYATRHPEEISGLVLADTFAPEFLGRTERLLRSVALRATIPPVRFLGYERIERAMVRFYEWLDPGAAGDYDEIVRLRTEATPISAAEFAKVIRAVASFHKTTIDPSLIEAPTLVLHGEHEPAFLERHAWRFGAILPNATVHEVPGAGHASNVDEPEWVAAVLREFLGATKRDRIDDVAASSGPDR
jgi:pimeloyl-ACP methyl ester carboxylesterase